MMSQLSSFLESQRLATDEKAVKISGTLSDDARKNSRGSGRGK